MARDVQPEMTEERRKFLEGEEGYGDDEIVVAGPDGEAVPTGDTAAEDATPAEEPDPYARLLPEIEEEDPLQALLKQYKPEELPTLIESGKNMQQMMAEAHRRNEEAQRAREELQREREEIRRQRQEVETFLNTVRAPDLDPEEAVEHLRRFQTEGRLRSNDRSHDPEYETLKQQFESMKSSFDTALQTLAADRVDGLLEGIMSSTPNLSPLERELARERIRNEVYSEIQAGRINGQNLKSRVPDIAKDGIRRTRLQSREDLAWRLQQLKKQEENAIPAGGPKAAARARPSAPAKRPGPGPEDKAARLKWAAEVMARKGFTD